MKRKLYLVGLVALVLVILVPLIFGGCVSTKKDTDTATPTLESVAADVATLKSQSSNYATQSQLSAFASQEDLDASKAEFESLLEEMMIGISTPDLSNYVTRAEYDAMVAEFEDRIAELEAGGGSSGGGGGTEGEVVVAIDSEAEPYTFTTGTTSGNYVIPVEIVNGTTDYQEVIFNVTLRCASTDFEADVTGVPAVDVNTIPMALTEVTAWSTCRYIYCVWTDTNTILVAPDKTTIVYVYLVGFQTSSYEIWEAILSDIIVTEL